MQYRRVRCVGRAEYEKIAGDFVSKDGAGLSKRTRPKLTTFAKELDDGKYAYCRLTSHFEFSTQKGSLTGVSA